LGNAPPANVPASGATFNLSLNTTPSCGWTASAISTGLYGAAEVSPTQGVGSGTIQIRVLPHTGIQSRTVRTEIATIALSTIQNAAAPPVPGPNAAVLYSGTADDTLSFGQAGVFTTDEYKISVVNVNGHPETVALRAQTKAPPPYPFPWAVDISLAPATGTTMTVGRYDNPPRFLGSPGAAPSWSVGLGSYTCDSSGPTGYFEIFAITLNPNGSAQQFHTKVVYHCPNDPPGSALTLEAWYPSKGAF